MIEKNDVVRVDSAPNDEDYACHVGEIGVVVHVTSGQPFDQLALVEFPFSEGAAYKPDELTIILRG